GYIFFGSYALKIIFCKGNVFQPVIQCIQLIFYPVYPGKQFSPCSKRIECPRKPFIAGTTRIGRSCRKTEGMIRGCPPSCQSPCIETVVPGKLMTCPFLAADLPRFVFHQDTLAIPVIGTMGSIRKFAFRMIVSGCHIHHYGFTEVLTVDQVSAGRL